MKNKIISISILLTMSFALVSCFNIQDWQMDYGKPAAQFYAHDVASKGKPFIGKKVIVKGEVLRVQDGEDGNHVYLENNIHCVFPTWHFGESSLKPGDEILVSGFLKKCAEGYIQLDPALMRDSSAPFKPID